MSQAASLEKDQASLARRNALIFACASAVIGSAAPVSISLGALAGAYLLGPDKSLATAPVTAFNLGVALGALPAAHLLRRFGQRRGFMAGTLLTAAGGAVAALALARSSFWLFAAGLLLVGLGAAFVQQFRFAAADNAPPQAKARAISFVLAGGVVTAVLGPQIVIHTSDSLAPVMFAGSFVAIVGLAAIGAVVLAFLAPPAPHAQTHAAESLAPRPLREIVAQPRFAVALVCAVGAYALMSFVMTGAPLAIVGCGFSTEDSTLGISWHVMAMFGPSFVTGSLIARFGAERVIAAGLLLLLACAGVSLSGAALWQFWLALILLGLGWNFGFIGATAMVASAYRASEKNKAQGVHDFVLFGSVAAASLLSGVAFNKGGWALLNGVVVPVALACLLALGVASFAARRPRSA